jgi:hypothetical protein
VRLFAENGETVAAMLSLPPIPLRPVPDNDGALKLSPGFCATIFADNIDRACHRVLCGRFDS